MVYVTIGKNGYRHFLDGSVESVRIKVIKYLKGASPLMPVFFYPTRTGKKWDAVMLPYMQDGRLYSYYVTPQAYWEVWTHGSKIGKITKITNQHYVDIVNKKKDWYGI